MEELRAAGGYFEDGVYKVKQPDGHTINKDSYEAVWEQVNGKPIAYSQPRYETPVIMRPQAFRWLPDPKRQGVEIKPLGVFNEFRTGVALWRIAPGTTMPSEVLDAPELRCVISGETVYDGKVIDQRGRYYIPEGVATKPIGVRRARNCWSTPAHVRQGDVGKGQGTARRRGVNLGPSPGARPRRGPG